MKIRSITTFYDPQAAQAGSIFKHLQLFIQGAVRRFNEAGYEVETTRIVTTPFCRWLPGNEKDALRVAYEMEQDALAAGITYLGFGPAVMEFPSSYPYLLPLLSASKIVFLGGEIARANFGISLPAIQACARVIEGAARITPDGFTNLRFTALANFEPWGPFFPAAYAGEGQPAFALAMEAADAAVDAFSRAASLAEARSGLLQTLETNGARLTGVAESLAGEAGFEFKGIDFSLAPFPGDWCSIGYALEQLGIPRLGLAGSVAAAAFLADTLDRGRWKRAGFNGLMLPVLEDSTLAGRSGQPLTLRDMLLFSAVCGTGLDTVPLPGDVSAAQLEGVLLDVAALSVRLDKPLTARLMPVPGKAAGEMTSFDFAYFSNGQVMSLAAEPLQGVMAKGEVVDIRPRASWKTRS